MVQIGGLTNTQATPHTLLEYTNGADRRSELQTKCRYEKNTEKVRFKSDSACSRRALPHGKRLLKPLKQPCLNTKLCKVC